MESNKEMYFDVIVIWMEKYYISKESIHLGYFLSVFL